MAELLLLEENLRFSTLMVDTLSTILLTSTELFDLRSVDGCVVEGGSNREFISQFQFSKHCRGRPTVLSMKKTPSAS
jgi:hypothetical protein